MTDPMKAFAEIQLALLQAWANTAQGACRYLQHCAEIQQRFFTQHPHRTHIEIAKGPSLTEKYGKRAHDIDPEKDV
ncbi:MAG: hypothetical protein ACM31L_09300 [Actinomycetota bacterium]